jgi:deoxyribonuclease-4
LNGSINTLLEQMRALKLSIFQAFLVEQGSGKLITLTEHETMLLRDYIQDQTVASFAHISYLVNPASDVPLSAHYAFRRELALAKQLGFSHIILHPGAAEKNKTKEEAIAALARFANTVMKKEPGIRLVLENVAFAKQSLGGDIKDFQLLLEQIYDPDRLAFCIDTAHAHSYGYDVITSTGQQEFIQQLDTCIGLKRIVLLHLNDTQAARGSQIDKHANMHEGAIGSAALKRFVVHDQLRHIPLVMELPVMDWQDEYTLVESVRTWT